MTFTVLRAIARTKIPSFNDKNFSRHLPENLLFLLSNILFRSKTDTDFFQK